MNEVRGKLARQASALNTRNARGARLPPLVLMTDDRLEADWAAAAGALPPGSAVIVRHRDARKRAVLAAILRSVCRARRVALLIADDPRLAERVRADGVHLPEARIVSIAGVRARNRTWLVTGAAHSAAAVRAALQRKVDGVFVSPAFATASHPERRALGATRLAALVAGAPRVYALGGIDAETIRRLSAHRIVGVGMIGGWLRS